jgi:hypothetical protein
MFEPSDTETELDVSLALEAVNSTLYVPADTTPASAERAKTRTMV